MEQKIVYSYVMPFRFEIIVVSGRPHGSKSELYAPLLSRYNLRPARILASERFAFSYTTFTHRGKDFTLLHVTELQYVKTPEDTCLEHCPLDWQLTLNANAAYNFLRYNEEFRAAMDAAVRSAGDPAGPPSSGSAGRRPFCHQ